MSTKAGLSQAAAEELATKILHAMSDEQRQRLLSRAVTGAYEKLGLRYEEVEELTAKTLNDMTNEEKEQISLQVVTGALKKLDFRCEVAKVLVTEAMKQVQVLSQTVTRVLEKLDLPALVTEVAKQVREYVFDPGTQEKIRESPSRGTRLE